MDVDGDGVVSPVQFRRLAKVTLRRAQQSATPSPHREQSYATAGRLAVDRRAAGGAEARPFDDIEGRTAARLRVADPFGLGMITFSECVQHLHRDIAAGARLESGRYVGCIGNRQKLVGGINKDGGKEAAARPK